MRRAPSIDALLPALYLKGISTGDFLEALSAILGEEASGLSANNIVRLKSSWETDYKVWSQRDLSAKRYVYWWADGVYFNVRLDEERSCVLILIGATEDGTKEFLAVVDGYRESTQSWRELPKQFTRLLGISFNCGRWVYSSNYDIVRNDLLVVELGKSLSFLEHLTREIEHIRYQY
jgi:transposase-like protein